PYTPALHDALPISFGTADKVALAVSLVGVCAVLAVGIGVLGLRRRPLAVAAVCLLAGVCALCALTRSDAGTPALLPSLLGGVAGIAVLHLLLDRAGASAAATGTAAGGDRRRFLAAAGGTVVASGDRKSVV